MPIYIVRSMGREYSARVLDLAAEHALDDLGPAWKADAMWNTEGGPRWRTVAPFEKCIRCPHNPLHAGDCETRRGRRIARRCSACGIRMRLYTSRDRKRRCKRCIAADPKVQRRRAEQQRERDAQNALESSWDVSTWRVDPIEREGIVRALVPMARAAKAPLTDRWKYVYLMARFHGGATGGYLGTAVEASMLVRDPVELETLDRMADQVAERAFGSSERAVRIWRRAMYGS